MSDETTRQVVEDFVEALAPLDVRMRAMFGGYCVYVNEKVVALGCDGAIFVKRSERDDLLKNWARLGHAYPGARPSWQLPENALRDEPERVRDTIEQVSAALHTRTKSR